MLISPVLKEHLGGFYGWFSLFQRTNDRVQLFESKRHNYEGMIIILLRCLFLTSYRSFLIKNDRLISILFNGSVAFIFLLACSCSDSKEIVVDCAFSGPIIKVNNLVNSDCEGATGQISVAADGGSGNLMFSIDDTVFQATGEFEGLDGGNYNVIVIDDNNCKSNLQLTLESGHDFSIGIEILSLVNCGQGNGSFRAIASGGHGDYRYRIDRGKFQLNGLFEGLDAGNYSLTVRDQLGCESIKTVNISEEQELLIESISSTKALNCKSTDGALLVMAKGGDKSYQYKIDDGDFQIENEFKNLEAGEYLVTVRDGKGCLTSRAAEVEEKDDIRLTQFIGTFPDCDSLSGKVEVIAVGGTGDYQYKLEKNNFQNSNEFEGLEIGKHEFFVRDEMGCTTAKTYELAYLASYDRTAHILKANCTISPCHNSSTEFTDFNKIENIRMYESEIINKVTFGNPKSKNGQLSVEEINQLACWFDKGATVN